MAYGLLGLKGLYAVYGVKELGSFLCAESAFSFPPILRRHFFENIVIVYGVKELGSFSCAEGAFSLPPILRRHFFDNIVIVYGVKELGSFYAPKAHSPFLRFSVDIFLKILLSSTESRS